MATAQAPLADPEVIPLAPGIWAIRNPRANESWPQGNTLVVAGSRDVLVVDAAYLPATARADIAIIQRLTKRPVRYLVNTHWHYDHTNGNGEYRRAFPQIDIIGHPETQRLLRENVPRYLAGALAADSPVRKSVLNSTRVLDSLAMRGDTNGRALYERRLEQRQLELDQLAAVTPALPNVLVERELRLDLGGRTVVVRHSGRANTAGDLTVFVPGDRILATGDIVVAPVPYAYNASPGSWIAVLDSLLALRPAIVVPGHGEIMRDATGGGDSVPIAQSTRYVAEVRAMLAAVVEHVRSAYRAGKTVDEARSSFDFTGLRARFAGNDAFLQQVFQSSIVTALVDRVWAEAQGAT